MQTGPFAAILSITLDVSPTPMAVHLDLRKLPPPEPMERILDAVQSLRPGEHIEALTPCWPEPLLPILEQQGCAWRREPSGSEQHARITIYLRGDTEPVATDP